MQLKTADLAMLAALVFASITPDLHAQAVVPAGAPAGNALPDSTTAAYGDWVLQCQRGAVPAPGPACELLHTVLAEGQKPIARLAIARIAAQGPLKLAVLLPTHVSFAETPRLSAGEAAGGPAGAALDLVWRRCLPIGCFADGDLGDAAARQWRAQELAGRLLFQDGSGRPVALPVSLRGLGEALDALARQ